MVVVHGVVLHHGNDHEPAAVRQRADLDRYPRECGETAGRRDAGCKNKRGQMQPEMVITPEGFANPSR